MHSAHPGEVGGYGRHGLAMLLALLVGWVVLSGWGLSSAHAENRSVSAPVSGVLDILISGFPNEQGLARVMLSNVQDGWPRDTPPLRYAALKIKRGSVQWHVVDLPYGEYTIRFYHDANNNDHFDTGWLGLPKERYGFSNNARPRLGPPSYQRARFQFGQPHMLTRLKVQ